VASETGVLGHQIESLRSNECKYRDASVRFNEGNVLIHEKEMMYGDKLNFSVFHFTIAHHARS
jgi:hypothetical protein